LLVVLYVEFYLNHVFLEQISSTKEEWRLSTTTTSKKEGIIAYVGSTREGGPYGMQLKNSNLTSSVSPYTKVFYVYLKVTSRNLLIHFIL
jgi:hypothetical protein